MSLAMILIPALLLYLAIVYRVLVHFKYKDIWRGNGVTVVTTNSNRLTSIVKRVLDIFLVFFLGMAIVWPLIIVVMALSHHAQPTWGIDISVFSGFKIDVDALPGVEFTGLRNPELSGKTAINIDTSNLFAWYLFALVGEIKTIAMLYALVQMRALVISLKNGVSFATENVLRVKKIGIVVIIWNLVNPFLQYFGWGAIIKDISFSNAGIQLYPAFQVNDIGIFIGLMMIVLSGVLQEAVDISKEQELTI